MITLDTVLPAGEAPARPDAAVTKIIRDAIAAGDYARNGVKFSPFMMKFAHAASLTPVWWSTQLLGQTVTFYRFSAKTIDDFLPLGDVMASATLPGGEMGPITFKGGVVLLAPTQDDPEALAHPLGFDWLLDDHGSGNGHDIAYWRPRAPDGYVALGICFGDAEPDANRYWCVREAYVRDVSMAGLWSDAGQGWQHNGNLNEPAFGASMPSVDDDHMLLIPRVCLSAQDNGDAAVKPRALYLGKATLPVKQVAPPLPGYDPAIVSDNTTAYGLGEVFILPYTAMRGDVGFPNQPTASPFYFVAAQPLWACTESWEAGAGGSIETTVRVGVSKTDSTSFEHATSLTVSAEFGAKLGPFSTKVSASYTESFVLTTATSTTHSTETEQKVSLVLPTREAMWFWVRQTQISVFRTDGSLAGAIRYGGKDHRTLTKRGLGA